MSVRTSGPRAPTRYLVVGGLCGLAWAAGLRGWMSELAGGGSQITWLTLVLVLLPGTIIGALLGWSAYLRSKGVRGSRWLVFSPLTIVHGLWASTLYEALLVLFALAASVPHSAAVNTGAGDTVPANWRGTLRLDDAEKRR